MAKDAHISAAISSLDTKSQLQGELVALITPERSITYGELAHEVAQLATTIIERCPPSAWLPIIVDRSIESVVAILAAIRAGRPYFPVEATEPVQRVADMLRIAGHPGSAVVATAPLAHVLPPGVVSVGPDVRHTYVESPVGVDLSLPGSLVFTSGSTGRPKGVVRPWRTIDNSVSRIRPEIAQVNTLRALVQPFSFIAGIGAIIQLTGGVRVCMIDPRGRTVDAVLDWLAAQNVTKAGFGGGYLDAVVRHTGLERRLENVREFSLTGSRADWNQVALIRRLCAPNVQIRNLYGATEKGLITTYVVHADEEIGSGRVPISRHPVGPNLKLVACDAGDEIWVKDPDALEYLGEAELTRTRFITDSDGQRWWRSGDTGAFDERGHLVLRGRVDHMVKISGMRIEPEEVEHVLRSQPGVTAAAVVAHPVSATRQRLVGHVCVDDEALTPQDLKTRLRDELPAHLVPAMFVRHDSLPFNDRLKIDYQALLEMPLRRWRTSPMTTSRLDTVLWLMNTIESIIGLGPVGATDDIWDSGLDSLGAVELSAAIAAEGSCTLDPSVLMNARTPIAIEEHLATRRQPTTSPAIVLNPDGAHRAIFAIPGGGGTSYAFRGLARALGSDQPLVVIEPRGMHCQGRVETSIAARVDSVIQEIDARLTADEMCLLIGYSAGGTIAFESARRLLARGQLVALILLDGAPEGDNTIHGVRIDWRARPLRTARGVDRWKEVERWMISRPRRLARILVDQWLVRRGRGPHRYSRSRYAAFGRVQRIATERHRLLPVDVATTLIHVVGSSLPRRCEQWVDLRATHELSGNHYSILTPPHVDTIARIVAEVRNDATRLSM